MPFSRFRVFDHSLTKLYVQGVRGRVRNIHCTGVQMFNLGEVYSIQLSEGGGHFCWEDRGVEVLPTGFCRWLETRSHF